LPEVLEVAAWNEGVGWVAAWSAGELGDRKTSVLRLTPGLICTPAALPAAGVVLSYQGSDPRLQAQVLRDVFGNPFRPVALDPRWRTADVLGLARGIYEDRASDRLPLLADALMDAGCDSDEILNHCRSDGPHVRGCWVVDLVLGKE
jgi:hypothetical protein